MKSTSASSPTPLSAWPGIAAFAAFAERQAKTQPEYTRSAGHQEPHQISIGFLLGLRSPTG
jgi:hypothetical protein